MKKMKKLLLKISMMLIVAPCYGQRTDAQIVKKSADEYSHLSPLLKRHADSRMSYEIQLEKAMLGDAQAMVDISQMYAYGKGIKRDLGKSIFWLERATEFNFGPAWTELGVCYKYGRGVSVNYTQAYHCFSKAADLQNPTGLYSKGFMQYKGLGCPQNYAAALLDFKRGADLGDPLCMYMMGLCYRNGFGTIKDLAQADFWLNKAAELGVSAAESEMDRSESEIDARAKEIASQGQEASILLNYAAYEANMFNRIFDIFSNLSGITYKGYWLKYDWSGEQIVKAEKITLLCEENAGTLGCNIMFSDSSIGCFFNGTEGVDNTIISKDFQLKRNDRYVDSYDDQLFVSQVKLGLRMTRNGENLLLGEVYGFSTHESEPERPIKIVLKRSIENVNLHDSKIRVSTQAIISPNPFTENCNIHLDVEETTMCQISITDINGRSVYQSNKENLTQGKYIYPLQTEFSPGTYFVTLLLNNDIKTLKLIKL
jgi:TPR repeat protein